MEEQTFRSGSVTVGGTQSTTFVVPVDDAHEGHELFSGGGSAFSLSTLAGMSGKVSSGGEEQTIDGAGRFSIRPGDWGVVNIGDVGLFFQFVDDDAAVIGASPFSALDFNLMTTLFIALVAHIVFLILCFVWYTPQIGPSQFEGVPDRFVSILVDSPPDVVEEIEEETIEDESMSQQAGGEEGRFGEEDAEVEDSVLPDHDGPMVDQLEHTELGRAFDAAIGMSGALTNVFGSSDMFSNNFGADFATAGEGDAFIVGRGSGGLGFSGTGRGGGGDGFGRVHGVGDIDTGGGQGQGASLGRREQREPRGRVERGRPNVNGFLSREQIERVVRRHSRGFRYCYERELQNDPELAGRVSVNWTIGLDGRVESASISENSMGDRNVESCILREVRRMRFDEPDGGMVVVTYPFTFRSDD